MAQRLTAIGDRVDVVLAELRSVAHGIYPAALEDGGLSGVLGSLVRSARTPVAVRDGLAGRRVQRDAEAALYLVAREALRNVDEHAAASGATVTVTHDNGQVRVAVADDGRGGATIGPRGGLAELADRVGALRGTLRVMDGPKQGTIVEAVIPCGS